MSTAAAAPAQDTAAAGAPPTRRGRRSVAAVALVVLAAVAVHLALQTSMLLARPDFSWHRFRGYFPFDQTSYLSIVVDGARGDSSFTEPFTGTGVDYYPHAYYLLLGLVARATSASPVLVWQVGGLVAQALLVAVLALATIAASGRRWTGLLAPLPFVVGTLSTLTGHGWYTTLHEHAVLWGAYAVLFTLNGESVSLCLGGASLLALLLVADGRVAPRARLPLAVVACLVIGASAGVQTYSFLTAAYLGAYVAAAWSLLRARPRTGVPVAVLSLALLVSLVWVGPVIATAGGPLVVLVSGLLPAVPGMVVLLVQLRWRLAVCAVAAVAGAAPQVLWTVHGVHAKDPFLLYRTVSTHGLGVGVTPALVAAAVPLLVLVLLLVAGIATRRRLWVAAPAGAVPAWAVLAANDRWGANQEPYRLWIDGFALVVVLALPLAVQAAVTLGSRPARWPARATSAAAVVAVLALVGASAGDFAGFWRYGRHTIPMLDYYTSQGDAVAALAGPGSALADAKGLRLPDTCLDPFLVKTRAELATAFYNYGMAWPDHEEAMGRLMAARTAGTLDVADARTAGVGVVLTDSTCAADWPSANAGALRHLASRSYRTADGTRARVDAWSLLPAS